MTSFLRPDEKAVEEQIKKTERFERGIKKGVKTAASIATAATGVGLASKIAPFLSEYVPLDLAIKGISRVSPEIGKFLKKGQSMGLDVKEGFEFIKNKLGSSQAQEQKNPVQKYSDELHSFLEGHIKEGRSPIEAGALAQLEPKYKKIIKKLEEDYKAPFSAILDMAYNIQRKESPSKEEALAMFRQHQGKPSMREELLEQVQGQYGEGQQAPGQAQQGNTDQAIMAALQKILQM